MLDALEFVPAFVKTLTWDLVAWNRAAAAVFGYGALAPEKHNILCKIFFDPKVRAAQLDWQSIAPFAVAAFRADAARAGESTGVHALVDELRGLSPEFDAIWRENDVHTYGEGTKKLRHPAAGLLEMEYSAFSVDGRPISAWSFTIRPRQKMRTGFVDLSSPGPRQNDPADPATASRRCTRSILLKEEA